MQTRTNYVTVRCIGGPVDMSTHQVDWSVAESRTIRFPVVAALPVPVAISEYTMETADLDFKMATYRIYRLPGQTEETRRGEYYIAIWEGSR